MRARRFTHAVSCVAALCAAGSVIAAEEANSLHSAITGGSFQFDGRLRYENVQQDNALRDADATTLRARAGYTTGAWHGFDGSLEFEGVTLVGSESYDDNPGPSGQNAYSVVADPAGAELNQAWLRFSGIPRTAVKAGRQRLIFDNARYLGNVGWRQNEQTFDGVLLTNTALPVTTLEYAFLSNANTILSSDFRMRSHAARVALAPAPAVGVTVYAYLLDFDADVPRTDSQTLGVRASGAIPVAQELKLVYALEYADQGDYQDAPATVDAEYVLAELGLARGAATAKVGYEVLGGDGVYGFQTPLATLHAFQGWADVFLATPAAGVRDAYASVGGRLFGVSLLGVYHDYRADSGGAHFGTEANLQATYAATPALSFGAKYADYGAKAFSVDTQKIWAWIEYRFQSRAVR